MKFNIMKYESHFLGLGFGSKKIKTVENFICLGSILEENEHDRDQ